LTKEASENAGLASKHEELVSRKGKTEARRGCLGMEKDKMKNMMFLLIIFAVILTGCSKENNAETETIEENAMDQNLQTAIEEENPIAAKEADSEDSLDSLTEENGNNDEQEQWINRPLQIPLKHVINRSSFINNETMSVYVPTARIINEKQSPNGNYTAINEDYKYIVIVNKNNEKIFSYQWDDEINNFPFAETVYLLDWADDESAFWFLSWQPNFIPYIAKVDMNNNVLHLYSFSHSSAIDRKIDTENEIFYSHNHGSNYDPDDYDNMTFRMYKFSVKDMNLEVIYEGKPSDDNFNFYDEWNTIR
jgi:hypothetical protein